MPYVWPGKTKLANWASFAYPANRFVSLLTTVGPVNFIDHSQETLCFSTMPLRNHAWQPFDCTWTNKNLRGFSSWRRKVAAIASQLRVFLLNNNDKTLLSHSNFDRMLGRPPCFLYPCSFQWFSLSLINGKATIECWLHEVIKVTSQALLNKA